MSKEHTNKRPIDDLTGFQVLDTFKKFDQRDDIFCRSQWDSKVKSDKPFLGCPRVVGHGKTMDPNKYASDDFHIFHYKNSDLSNAGRNDKVFQLNNIEEVQSLKSYLETKFARFALSICKISQDSYVSRYFESVPLPPLDRQWTEQSIMEYYSIKSEHVEYINTFIPDYYVQEQAQ